MYRIGVRGAGNTHEYEELVKIFLRPDEYSVEIAGPGEGSGFDLITSGDEDKNIKKQEIYRALSALTGESPEWGIITGIRPVKLFGEIARECPEDAPAHAEKVFREYYLVSEEKTDLTRRIYELQQERFGEAEENSMGVYTGIPFCPTRCLYCSFASNPIDGSDIEGYLAALEKEIGACSEMAGTAGMLAESIYIGGGTPTTLDEDQLRIMIEANERQKAIEARGADIDPE